MLFKASIFLGNLLDFYEKGSEPFFIGSSETFLRIDDDACDLSWDIWDDFLEGCGLRSTFLIDLDLTLICVDDGLESSLDKPSSRILWIL